VGDGTGIIERIALCTAALGLPVLGVLVGGTIGYLAGGDGSGELQTSVMDGAQWGGVVGLCIGAIVLCVAAVRVLRAAGDWADRQLASGR
jgi:hypothetical protein